MSRVRSFDFKALIMKEPQPGHEISARGKLPENGTLARPKLFQGPTAIESSHESKPHFLPPRLPHPLHPGQRAGPACRRPADRLGRRATASGAPETANINFGIIALTDCSPIVIAHEKGLLQKVWDQLHGNQGRELGGDPRLARQWRHRRPRTCCSACRSPRPWV